MVAGTEVRSRRQDCRSVAVNGMGAPVGWRGRRRRTFVRLGNDATQITVEERSFTRYLLVRRSLDEKREHAYYVVHAPRSKASLQILVNVAGRRWEIETVFEATKGECGLDQYEVRRWRGGANCPHFCGRGG